MFANCQQTHKQIPQKNRKKRSKMMFSIIFEEMSVGRKYNQYLKDFPINIQWRITLTKDHEGFTRDNIMYFGPRFGSMKNGSYGICFEKHSNGCLVIREGEWKRDRLSGRGSAYYIPKAVKGEPTIILWKEGEWLDDELCGKGIIREYNTLVKKWETTFTGQFQHGYKHGLGVAYFSGCKYQGHFEYDNFHGHARLTKSQGNFYDGEFVHGRPCGRGIERRNTEIVVFEGDKKEVFSAPFQDEDLANFYYSLIDKI